jgi:BirA family biotin operon repressor/biotin-[acetyl-CoA-carboxylase] ligase
MTLREKILETLEENRGSYCSGEELANVHGVSRAAVWKAVRRLMDEGYDISAAAGSGYMLSENTDILSAAAVEKYLDTHFYSVDVRRTVDSTNSEVRRLAVAGAAEGAVVIAEDQTAGRGRMGRSFFSPGGSGLYMSVLLRPTFGASKSLYITTAAAVAAARTLEEVSGVTAGIKWVNDIYMHDRKVCGILTEGAFALEDGGLEYAVLGIGVNVNAPAGGFPEDIENKAGAVFDSPIPDMRSRIAAGILTKFHEYYRHLEDKEFLAEYKARDVLVGHTVDVIRGDSRRTAVVMGVTDEFELLVKYDSGAVEPLSCGEVSILKK